MELFNNERVDHILQRKVIQSSEVFSFSLDAVMLGQFVWLPIQKGRVIDLCSGNGVIPLILSTRSNASIDGIEIQERLFDMAKRSVSFNKQEEQIKLYHSDINDLPEEVLQNIGRYDVVTCNPPYFKTTKKREQNLNEHYTIARHEIYCTLDDVIRVSSRLVKSSGKVAIVHRPNRLIELMDSMRKYLLEPKRMQLVYPKEGAEANMVLVEAIKGGKPDLRILPPFFVYNQKNEFTKEMKKLYGLE
ncbi:tRNA1(Val) (adenine(37)-N6)-methyltransferase [Pseudalkalibacillus caeni]|uniref:tRNA1(Val) (Adenine(37)-N6)-methyltransferase n=1 Tax=Exobacillus caeni TaxID=2574798 RepID=A0A5R9F5L6_9BACL|nr:tRNA1(Val) (adenine(37)-N6)-methyltransferase [Pseudalkalibacillus caeni]TLS35095.1 tRNA1(Val) (adenine(37)-N6)-methyltransferase [Pseudalkalibacillus caeni]